MGKTEEQLMEEIKVKAAEVFKAHFKAALHEVNSEVLPSVIDLATLKIPGTLDDSIAAVAKPIIQQTLDAAIDAI